MEVIAVRYFPNSVDPGRNERSKFRLYISYENEQGARDSNSHIIRLFLFKIIELGLFVSGVPIVWEDTYYFANQYICAFSIYLMTTLSSLCGIIMDCSIDAPVYVDNFFDIINATYRHYLKWGV